MVRISFGHRFLVYAHLLLSVPVGFKGPTSFHHSGTSAETRASMQSKNDKQRLQGPLVTEIRSSDFVALSTMATLLSKPLAADDIMRVRKHVEGDGDKSTNFTQQPRVEARECRRRMVKPGAPPCTVEAFMLRKSPAAKLPGARPGQCMRSGHLHCSSDFEATSR